MRRMDRYNDEKLIPKMSRSNKNQDLYGNTRYTNLTDVKNINIYDLKNIDKNREKHERARQYSNLIPLVNELKSERELEEFKSIHKIKGNRVYDINSVMAEARKNRKVPDEKEAKRKLKNEAYNILINLSKEELEEYRKKRKMRFTHPDEEELHDLIDTIASKTLAGEIDKNTSVNLLSELMATTLLDKLELPLPIDKEDSDDNTLGIKDTKPVKTEKKLEEKLCDNNNRDDDVNQDELSLSNQIISKDDLEKINEAIKSENFIDRDKNLNGADTDFYTKSMELTREDFENEMDDEFKEKSLPLLLKIIFLLIFLGVIALAAYFIWQM